jgi:SAM-dependent methyltransferase
MSVALAEITVPAEAVEIAAQSVGAFFEPISTVDRYSSASDFMELSKSFKRAALLEKYQGLAHRKVLEIGSGFGTNLAVWVRHFDADVYGVEPGSTGFNDGYIASRMLLAANGIDPERVIDSAGESLPFPDESFDIVYSANVLEHTDNPERVLMEALRVLRPGGLLHMEMPNFLSYFEGHYMVVMPPILWNAMLAWWVKLVYRRDPAFARTLRTRINPFWCRRQIAKASKVYPLELISLGEDTFLERLAHAFRFETKMAASSAGGWIAALQRLNRGNWVGRLIVALRGHYPIYLSVRKSRTGSAQ